MNTTAAPRGEAKRTGWSVLLFCLAATTAAFLLLGTARAQDRTEYEYVDLLMLYEQGPDDERSKVQYSVRNIGTTKATGVTVSFLLEDLDLGPFTDSPDFPDEDVDSTTKQVTFTWEIGTILAGDSARPLTFATGLHDGHGSANRIGVINATASAHQPEPGILSANNVIKIYSFASSSAGASQHMDGNRLALLLSVDELEPGAGDDVNFGLTARNFNGEATNGFYNLIGDVDVRIELSDGLKFKTGWNPSNITVAPDRRSAAWSPPDTDTKGSTTTPNLQEIEIQTQLTSDSLEDIPREERCITAWVEGSKPPPTPDYAFGSLTQCLGGDPPVLFDEGELNLFYLHPCAGVTPIEYPCRDENSDSTVDNGLELVVQAAELDQPVLRRIGVARRDGGSGENSYIFFRPENVVVRVDPEARVGTKWYTGSDENTDANDAGIIPGVLAHLDLLGDNGKPYTFAIADVDPKRRPGTMALPRMDNTGFTILDADTKKSLGPVDSGLDRIPVVVVFGTLGTNVVDITMGGTYSGTAYTPKGRYTFHVGPVAEMEVRDASPQPGLATTQRAFTIVAVNNGPDDAPAAQVTLSGLNASDYVSHTATAGTFNSSTGVWTVGELGNEDFYQGRYGREGEVLTIITNAAADAEVTATISNTQDYRVCIDSSGNDVVAASESACTGGGNTWHTTEYYDYISDNNSATIQSKTGTGANLPTLRGAEPKTAAIEITWNTVSDVNGRPVAYYEVQRQSGTWSTLAKVSDTRYVDTSIAPEGTFQYRIRAVNDWNHKGPWSQSTEGMAETVGVPGFKTSTTSLELAEGASGQYTIVLKAKPSSNVSVSVNAGGDVSANPSRLTFTPSNWFTPQIVTLTAAHDGDAADDSETIIHTVSSSDGAYSGLTLDSVAVTVSDDDSGISIETQWESVNEGDDIVFTLTRAGRTAGAVTVALNVAQSGDYLASGEDGGRNATFAAGATEATLTLTTVNDAVQESPGTVTATLTSGSGYLVSQPNSVTVQVLDDDGLPGQPGELAAVEGDGQVELSWTDAPTGSAPVLDYWHRVRRADSSVWDPDWTRILGTNSHRVGGLENGREYVFQVRARNATGDGAVAEVRANPKDEPDVPYAFVYSRHESLVVNWLEPDDGGRPISEYQVQWKSGSQAFEPYRQETTTSNQHTITGLDNGTEYTVRVQAVNEVGESGWSTEQRGTPVARPATTLAITTDAQDGVSEPFRVTFTFTDDDHNGNSYGVAGFTADDISLSYGAGSTYQYTVEDFREETKGLVYSARVGDIVDGTLAIQVAEGAAQSTHDGQGNTAAYFYIRVDPPAMEPPAGNTIWSATMTAGYFAGNAQGYIDPDLTIWDLDEQVGSLSTNTFTYAGKGYVVGELTYISAWNAVVLVTCPGLEGADGTFGLYLDDADDGDPDIGLTFDPDEVKRYEFNRTVDGVESSCVEYGWQPQRVDWKVDTTVNAYIVR